MVPVSQAPLPGFAPSDVPEMAIRRAPPEHRKRGVVDIVKTIWGGLVDLGRFIKVREIVLDIKVREIVLDHLGRAGRAGKVYQSWEKRRNANKSSLSFNCQCCKQKEVKHGTSKPRLNI